MLERLKKKFTKYVTRVELRDLTWFDCEGAKIGYSSAKPERKYIAFPDGLRIIVEAGKYVGFYTQEPYIG